MNQSELTSIARQLVAEGKGILAADESTGTITRRFQAVGVESTEDTRRAYREMLFTAPGIESHLSGVILYDETIRQNASTGTPLREILSAKGILPGIKVDTGAKPLALFPGETITEGLDGLRERIAEYVEMGAKFAKWRAVITIGRDQATGARTPTPYAIRANAQAMARYAALCQKGGLVPIVEPEVLIDGDHTIQRSEEVTTEVLWTTFDELAAHRVFLEGLLLKPSMVISGTKSAERANAQAVATATIRTLRRTVPPAVPGIVFLSGGQTPEQATEHLSLMNQMEDLPWEVSFSYARALQGPAMEAWRGRAGNVAQAQRLFYQRVRLAGAARMGAYRASMEASA